MTMTRREPTPQRSNMASDGSAHLTSVAAPRVRHARLASHSYRRHHVCWCCLFVVSSSLAPTTFSPSAAATVFFLSLSPPDSQALSPVPRSLFFLERRVEESEFDVLGIWSPVHPSSSFGFENFEMIARRYIAEIRTKRQTIHGRSLLQSPNGHQTRCSFGVKSTSLCENVTAIKFVLEKKNAVSST